MALPTPTVKEHYPGRRLGVDAEGHVTATRVFHVAYPDWGSATTGEIGNVETAALTAVGINRFDAHPSNAYCLALTAEVAPADSTQFNWTVTYGYTTKFEAKAANAEVAGAGLEPATSGSNSSPKGGDKSSTSPNSRGMEIKSIKRVVQEVHERDAVTAALVVNSAKDRFDPPAMVERTYLGYQVKFYRTLATLRWATAVPATPPLGRSEFIDTINNAAFSVFGKVHPEGTIRVADVSVSIVWDFGASALNPMAEISVELLENPDGWKSEILDQGYRQRKAGTPDEREPLMDANGQQVSEPQPLDGSGYLLGDTASFVYLSFWQYPKVNLLELFT